jgi:hypothetical protein
MNIVFICASAEPGRDGVGDYTRRLAAACAELGHRCLILALNDRHVNASSTELHGEMRTVCRWSADLPWWVRIAAARDRISRFEPDWISWQMVSYGYQPKGILGPEIMQLARELRAPRMHVMLHEIWIGLAQGDSFWSRIIGWRQRRALLRFLRIAAPDQLNTSNQSYVAALGRHGWSASVLPLFSNIPITSVSSSQCEETLARHLPPATTSRGRLVGVTFGTLHRQWQPEAAARLLQSAADRQKREPVLLAIGRIGPNGAAILERIKSAGITVAVTGELPVDEVSCLLQAADLGIAPHPTALIRKSGVVAAMLDHGLPVLMPRDDWHLRHGPTPNGAHDPRLARLADLSATGTDTWLKHRQSPDDSLPATVARFLDELSA